MPLPSKRGSGRQFADLRAKEINDPEFETPAKVYMRPLLTIEIDKADAEAREFVARHFDGGFVHPVTEEWTEKPEPILVDGEPVPLDRSHAITMHRYEAMQRPMRGNPPTDQTFVTVADMVAATVQHDAFWCGFEAFANEVWRDGQTGKAWGREAPSTPPASA